MSVRQLPEGGWAYRFQVGRRLYRKQTFPTRAEAQKAEALKKADAIRISTSNPEYDDKLKLAEAAERYYEDYSRPYKKNWRTVRSRVRIIKTFFGDRRIRDLNPRDVEAFRRYVRRTVRGVRQPEVALTTVNHYHAALKAIINWAKRQRMYYGENPAWGVEMAKVERARVRFLYPQEEKQLTPVVAKEGRLWPYYVMALHTGMRLGEVCAIRVKDYIPYPEPMIFVPHSKSNRSRHVPLSEQAAELVRGRIKDKKPDASLLGGWSSVAVAKWFMDACKEAEVNDFTFHCLRHTFTGHMLGRGVPIYKVSKMLGHSSVVVTEQHYGHMDRSTLSQEIHHIGDIISMSPVTERAVEVPSEGKQVVNGMEGRA